MGEDLVKLLRASLSAAGLGALAMLAGCIDWFEKAPTCANACQITRAEDLAAGKTSLSPKTKITENGVLITPGMSWLAGAKSVHIHGAYAQASIGASQALVLGTGVGADGRPAVFGLRIVDDGRGAAWEAELLVTHKGEASLFPTAIPLSGEPLMDQIVPAGRRSQPSVMIAAANAYFDGIEAKSGADVPATPDCGRVENGVQTGNSNLGNSSPGDSNLGDSNPGSSNPGSSNRGNSPCSSLAGFDYIKTIRDRRFPITDVEHGIVVAAAVFDIPGGAYPRTIKGEQVLRDYKPRSLLLFEVFKVEDGKIRHIEATMRDVPLGAPSGWAGQPHS
jgi:hypothetical protein